MKVLLFYLLLCLLWALASSLDLLALNQGLTELRANLTRLSQKEKPPEKPSCKKPIPYDLLILSLQWTPAICVSGDPNKDTRCVHEQIQNQFTIHGLWPSHKNNPRHPAYCCGDTLNIKEIKSQVQGLEKIWQSVYNTGNERFWTRQWEKHGRCAGISSPAITTPVEYFKTTVMLYSDASIKEWLSKRDILPSPDKFYSIKEVMGSIEAQTGGKSVTLVCRSHNRTRYLREIRVCFDPQTLNLISCPRLHQGCRGGKFKIIPKKVDFD